MVASPSSPRATPVHSCNLPCVVLLFTSRSSFHVPQQDETAASSSAFAMSAYALPPPAPSNPPPTPRLPTETVFIVTILSKLSPSSSAMVPSAAVRKLAQRATMWIVFAAPLHQKCPPSIGFSVGLFCKKLIGVYWGGGMPPGKVQNKGFGG